MLNAANIAQILMSGLLMGLIYALIAAGLSLIFGLMDVVNFAHGEFTVVAMYAAWFMFKHVGVDPLLAALPIALVFFCIGYVLQRALVIRFVGRAEHEQFILARVLDPVCVARRDINGPALFY